VIAVPLLVCLVILPFAHGFLAATLVYLMREIRRKFNEEEYLAALRNLERTGGVSVEEIMAEIDRKLHGRNGTSDPVPGGLFRNGNKRTARPRTTKTLRSM
jgi:hypothetical protein